MAKKNCWEVKKCGRHPGGNNLKELGECPAVKSFAAHGINNGINGGRGCWAIAGTFCKGAVQGTFADKIESCTACNFYQMVQDEEGNLVTSSYKIVEKIRKT